MKPELNDDSATDSFDWGTLGEKWWRDAAAEVGAKERQVKFACAIHGRASAAGAARLAGNAGLADTPESDASLTEMIRSPDPTTKLRAIEAFNKMDAKA